MKGLFAVVVAIACLSAPVRAADAPIDFHGIIARAMAIYVPRFAANGVTLSFFETNDDMIKGGAYRDEWSRARITFDTGYYKDPLVGADGFLFAVCHELGHVVASAPHLAAPGEWDGPSDKYGNLWMANEGQSDYYAAAKCMRLVLAGDDNIGYLRAHPAPHSVAKKCARQFPDPGAAALCQRIALAGKNFLDSLAIPQPTSFETSSSERVEKTYGGLPARQCRLDTILAGALCTAPSDADVDPYDPALGFCASGAGARPPCWFKE